MAHGQGGAEIGFDRGPCLTCNHEAPIAAYPVAFPANLSGTQCASTEDLAPAMGAKNPTAVAQPIAWDNDLNASVDQMGTLIKGGAGGRHEGVMQPVVAMQAMAVRRLTPVECERLQGFPDNYTAIPWRKKPADECPDGPRYKALGNSWAVPVVRWIGKRIKLAVEIAAPANDNGKSKRAAA